MRWYENQRNIKIRTFPPDVLGVFKNANSELLVQVADRLSMAKQVIDGQEEFLGIVKEWSAIIGKNYLQLR